ncbi:MAG UNVERIFIED_CONTAM: hypothetical protein LVQ98_09310 [Rickettsiaceae bacterium]|jgi:hypothetical protein
MELIYFIFKNGKNNFEDYWYFEFVIPASGVIVSKRHPRAPTRGSTI